MSRIYLASSWRNPLQPSTVDLLRLAGHQVYDFRNPPHATGFGWHEIGLDPKLASAAEVREKLYTHPRAAALVEAEKTRKAS